ncbi:MAG: SMC-Scp complex subunit ScpB [Clostridia bacterium]|nr:SMC-Scp complex subunit ScpB [Clostridia bacterium]
MEKLTNIIESILFVSGNAVAISDISERLECTDKEILAAAKELQKKYSDPCGINLLIFNKKIQLCSNPKYSEPVAVVLNPIRERELSKSMLEVAAIIAYKQPVTRLDLEEIRGNSEYAIQNLLKLGVIEIVGRKDAVGRPVLFGTTDEFLKRFEISSLDELPNYEELMSRIRILNGNDGDNYLYKKDEYVEGQDDNLGIDISSIPKTSDKEDFVLKDFADEELPDFLVGEDVSVIGGDDLGNEDEVAKGDEGEE